MASILSSTASSSLAESPIIVETLATTLLTSSSLKLVCDLYVWDGSSSAQPATPTYTLKKFPLNQGGSKKAVFDFSPILNSFTTSSLAELPTSTVYTTVQTGSNTKWFSYDVYEEAKNTSNQVITGSHALPSTGPFIATEGYLKWGEKRNLSGYENLSILCPDFPLLTSAPATQSLYRTDLPIYTSVYTRNEGNTGLVNNVAFRTANYQSSNAVTASVDNTNRMVQIVRLAGSTITSYSNLGQTYIDMLPRTGSGPEAIGGVVKRFQLECTKKYTPQRIIFKNRWGGIDQFDFNLVSVNTMNAETLTYQQNALNMTQGYYDKLKGVTTYNTQGTETITVNTDYVGEEYNEFFKEMMVSEEIYLVKPSEDDFDSSAFGATWLPLTLASKNLTFKTHQVDKLIQYTFTFNYATPYKLVL